MLCAVSSILKNPSSFIFSNKQSHSCVISGLHCEVDDICGITTIYCVTSQKCVDLSHSPCTSWPWKWITLRTVVLWSFWNTENCTPSDTLSHPRCESLEATWQYSLQNARLPAVLFLYAITCFYKHKVTANIWMCDYKMKQSFWRLK